MFIKSKFKTDSKNAIYLNQYAHWHVWLWNDVHFNWPQGSCQWFDSRKNVLVKCRLFSIRADHTRVFCVPTDKSLKE